MDKNYFWGPYFIEIGLEPNYGVVFVTTFDLIVYVEWGSRVNYVTILVTYIKINVGAYVTIQTSSHI